MLLWLVFFCFFFFKQKTAYEMRISDWSSDVCSSDLILADDDLIHIDRRRRPENRIGFALQLCALRYPGRTLAPGELIPHTVSAFLGAQLGIAGETPAAYAVRRQTRHQHMEALRRIYGYKMFPGRGPDARAFRNGHHAEAEQAEH